MSRPHLHLETSTLADGRKLLYFDAEPGAGRASFADKRDLGDRAEAGQLRYDPLRDEWVAVSAGRNARPQLPVACPLCPSDGEELTEIPAPDYDVAVFENRFPSFGGETDEAKWFGRGTPAEPGTGEPGLEISVPATGSCEVVVFSSRHDASFVDLPPERVELVVRALAQRTADLSARGDVAQVFCFENRGEDIGVTLHHPHGQIYGYPYVTPQTRRHLEAAARHRRTTGRDLFGDILDLERSGPRVVAANDHWTAFVPYAARWPFEVHLYPHERFADLAELPDEYVSAFAPLYLEVLRRFENAFPEGRMPYMAGWHQAPVGEGRDLARLRLELVSIRRAAGKVKYLASSESIMGGFVNDLGPEKAAEILREAL
ncbi:galactose-1-phosphate uridylyltransferase [Glycomyces xiaoerkulensis]|uniref:galactose-1-phosphate uridylyltransferase n=1 Tax=Glycomyces xiaoerkulensis TaxID=2038139 RepID=UPI001E41A940|nr:galactose-1-phosphate uridylyltransferase [Glycomyces xiaoerkulensis]